MELDLRAHQKTQTEEKFYKSDKYREFLHQNSPLSVHQESTTGEESLESNECRRLFYKNACLIQHQRTCSGEKTQGNECGKSFSNSHPIHYSGTHMEVNLHACNECGKTFCQTSNLSEHLKVYMITMDVRNLTRTLLS